MPDEQPDARPYGMPSDPQQQVTNPVRRLAFRAYQQQHPAATFVDWFNANVWGEGDADAG